MVIIKTVTYKIKPNTSQSIINDIKLLFDALCYDMKGQRYSSSIQCYTECYDWLQNLSCHKYIRNSYENIMSSVNFRLVTN